jgi:peptidylprolyl isomerase
MSTPRPNVRARRLAGGVVSLALALTLVACGDDDGGDDADATTAETVVDDVELVPAENTEPPADQPTVEPPAEIPTELVVTDLTVGSGHEATIGDTVFVNYVGVRSEDGVEFDSNYDGQPFPVTLGTGGVIPGWEQGLLGVQAGGQRRLDIPSDQAYGDQPRGDVIRAGDALTFVIDVRAVVPKPDPADAPTDVSVPVSEGATETTSTDAVVGEGEPLEPGDVAIVNVLLYRGDNSALVYDSWARGEPLQVQLEENQSLPGFVEGLPGMRVGGVRVLTIPPVDAFGIDGNPQAGLPANTDLVAVVELVGTI